MILSKTTEIKINAANFKHYKHFYNDIKCNQLIQVSITELTKFSVALIRVKCDKCGNEHEITYKNYSSYGYNSGDYLCKKCKLENNNLEKYGVKNVFQTIEVKEKIKKGNLEKYGVEFISQSIKIQQKIKETNLEKYGVEHHLQREEVRNKIKSTNIKKYGIDNPSKLNFIKEKKKRTTLKNYGVECSLHNESIKNNIKNSNFEKYGVEYNLQREDIKSKIKLTNSDKYGVDNYSKTKNFLIKNKEINLEKYGVDNYNKSEESKLNTIIGQNPNYIKYIGNSISLFNCDNNGHHEFEIYIDNFHSRIKQNLPLCTICFPISDNRSIKEHLIYEYIHSIYPNQIIQSYRDVIEIDIYLPNLKLGFEFNGIYWHSDKYKENNYHLNKQNYFREKGIDIKFILEDDWDYNKDIIKSQIKNWIGKTDNRIFGRKTICKEITDISIIRDFLNNNHIQGYVNSVKKYGLYYNNQLVSLMIFDKKEGRNNMKEKEWNLSRFCNLLNTQVVGGASKLLSNFVLENNPKRIISYADKDWSNGNLYFYLGFNLISESKPDYKYVVNGHRKSKQNFTKSKLKKLGHDITLTESKIMENLGINKIYDCGKMKFEKNI